MANRNAELAGQTAVVTGSSSGIGRAIAIELAAAGAACIIHAGHRRQAADDVAAEIRASGGEATVVVCDLTEPTNFQRLVDEAWQWRGAISIWVNNAGADVLTGEAAKWNFDRKLDRLWQVDVRATIGLARLAGARMQAVGEGAIVNIGWDQATTGMAGDSGELFAATKGAVMAFSASLARSLAPQVRVNCVAPGWIKTAWGEKASEFWQRKAREQSLLARWGTPADVAQVVRFLVSPASSFITGQVIPVNGGLKSSS